METPPVTVLGEQKSEYLSHYKIKDLFYSSMATLTLCRRLKDRGQSVLGCVLSTYHVNGKSSIQWLADEPKSVAAAYLQQLQ